MREESRRIALPIKTERLLLRPYLSEDADAFYQYMSDDAVLRFEPYPPLDRASSDEELAKRISDPDFIAVCLPPDDDHPWGRLIGHIFFSPCAFSSWEIGWMLGRAYWKQGYAKEAAAAVIDCVPGRTCTPCHRHVQPRKRSLRASDGAARDAVRGQACQKSLLPNGR